LIGDDHFSVDHTLIQAWGSQKNFHLKNEDDSDINSYSRNAESDFYEENAAIKPMN